MDTKQALKDLQDNIFIPKAQKSILRQNLLGEESEHFVQIVEELKDIIENAPNLYETDGKKDKKPVLHYFYGSYDAYAFELDKNDGTMFGYVSLGYGYELGYFYMDEINTVPRIELDLYFDGKLPSDINEDYKKENKMNIKKLNEEINSLLSEDLDKDVHYNFTIKKISDDTLKLTSGESEFEVSIRPEDDLQDIRYAIEDFVDGELSADEDDSENITGTEVVGFKYDAETGEGEFEATIFFAEDEDIDESLNEALKLSDMKKYIVYSVYHDKFDVCNSFDTYEEADEYCEDLEKSWKFPDPPSYLIALKDKTDIWFPELKKLFGLDESVEEENEIAENKRKKKAYVKAYEALEDLQIVLEEGVDPATGLLDDDTDMLYQLLQKTINEIHSRSLAFD